MSRQDVTDRLVLFGVKEDKARAFDKYTATKVLRGLEDTNTRLTNCSVEALADEMTRAGVRVVLGDEGHKIVADGAEAVAWVKSVLPTLRVRKAEIVAHLTAPRAGRPEGAERCVKCLGLVYSRADAGVVCEWFMSCPCREAS